jgi:hypothetical protein
VSAKRRCGGFGLFEFLVLSLATAVVVGIVIGLVARSDQPARDADRVSAVRQGQPPTVLGPVASGGQTISGCGHGLDRCVAPFLAPALLPAGARHTDRVTWPTRGGSVCVSSTCGAA